MANQQTLQQMYGMDRLPEQSRNIFEPYKNPMGEKMASDFLGFLHEFELQPGDPSYELYATSGLDEQRGAFRFYFERAQEMKASEQSTLFVDFSHLDNFQWPQDSLFMANLQQEYQRYENYLLRAVTQFLNGAGYQITKNRYFQLAIVNLPQVQKIRELKTGALGKLISITGTVTRTTEVKPELINGTFECKLCRAHNPGIDQQFKYTEPVCCINTQACQNTRDWELLPKDSIFLDWQKIRVQEDSSEIPAGSMPRSLDIVLRGDIVDQAKPGDRSCFTGQLIVVPDIVQIKKPGEQQQSNNVNNARMNREGGKPMDGVMGLKETGVKDLSYKMVFLANSVTTNDSRMGFDNSNSGVNAMGEVEKEEDQVESKLNPTLDEQRILQTMRTSQDLYRKMAESISPNVFGHQDVKKGLLLQMMGGVPKCTPDGIKLRGDINICIVGDPATAKSQFLKYVCQFLPRAVYTSGKSSSAAGLTASVRKDMETGEYCIEAGALMLADYGVCCIDEFDKMEVHDQVAIHEAMEQQTISIAKAGIHATLNARTSILAAANPISGRYDRAKTLKQNVEISPPIMSRFDLFFVIFDEKDDQKDMLIAQHIVGMHRLRDAALSKHFSKPDMQTYIKLCRALKPQFTTEAAEILKKEYKDMRRRDASKNVKTAYKTTVRQLESLVRLSEAMARLHSDSQVKPSYVKEVCRLLKVSNIQLVQSDIEFDEENIQDQINVDAQAATDREAAFMAQQEQEYERQAAQENNASIANNNGSNLFDMEREMNASKQTGNMGQRRVEPVAQPVAAQQADAEPKKVTMTYQEYTRLSEMIVVTMREMVKDQGVESIVQANLVNDVVKKLSGVDARQGSADIGATASVADALAYTNKLQKVITKLINEENVLIVTQDSKNKSERLVSLNINLENDDEGMF